MNRSLPPAAILAVLLLAAASPARDDPERGAVVAKKIRSGAFLQYLPKGEPRGVLVIAHGMPSAEEAGNIAGLAGKFLDRWAPFAEEHRLIAVAPVFDAENFDSVKGDHGGGYRGLFGRQVGADEFVDQIVVRYKPGMKSWDGRILLYGHSAGGQFANHYLVRHPDRVRAAVVSAAGMYAFPDPAEHWPYGMAPWRTTFRWDPNQPPQAVNVRPDPASWLKAATLPALVVVGAEDKEPQKARPGHAGNTRVGYAEQWVAAMNRLARTRRREGTIRLAIIPGVGHDSARLTPTAQEFLADALKAD